MGSREPGGSQRPARVLYPASSEYLQMPKLLCCACDIATMTSVHSSADLVSADQEQYHDILPYPRALNKPGTPSHKAQNPPSKSAALPDTNMQCFSRGSDSAAFLPFLLLTSSTSTAT